MKLHIKVPATSANMGPGFDCAGIALKLYNELWVENIASGIEIISKDHKCIPKDESNLIYSTIKDFYTHEHIEMPGIRIEQKDDIPMTRGLGSSAACVVGGLLAANRLSGRNYDIERLAQIAAEIEGHPDNSNPAIFGSMIISAMYEKGMQYVRINVPENLTFAVMIPDFTLSTKKARAVLPDSYARSQSIFNSSRTGLMVASMMTGKFENLRVAMDDMIHQPYRKSLIRGYDTVFDAARKSGSIAEYLSGAGPTLMALITDDKVESFEKNMNLILESLPDQWELRLLKPELGGALIEME